MCVCARALCMRFTGTILVDTARHWLHTLRHQATHSCSLSRFDYDLFSYTCCYMAADSCRTVYRLYIKCDPSVGTIFRFSSFTKLAPTRKQQTYINNNMKGPTPNSLNTHHQCAFTHPRIARALFVRCTCGGMKTRFPHLCSCLYCLSEQLPTRQCGIPTEYCLCTTAITIIISS